MIKNVVFDLGRVLLTFEPEKYLEDMGFEKEIAEKLMNRIFRHKIWSDFDRGVYSMAEMRKIIRDTNPELADGADRILQLEFFERLELKKDTEEFLRSLKAEGYEIYFLSNFASESFRWVEPRYDFFKLGSGKIISGYVGLNKPEPEIYELLMNTYNLQPAETVFIDDIQVNVEAAENMGIHGIVFTSAEDTKEQFRRILAKQA